MERGGALRKWAAGAAFAGVLVLGGTAHAALADRLCLPTGAAQLSAYPSATALSAAAASTETRLTRGLSADRFPQAAEDLEVPADKTEPPSPEAIASYCAAAGELMRVSPQGSQRQAQAFLLGAFRTATAARLTGPASEAAYRLGLVSLSGQTVAGTRGARGRRGAPGGAVTAVREAEQIGGGPCDLLLGSGALINANLRLSVAALACAAEEARLAGDAHTAALANLRLARLRLSIAEANTEVAAGYRSQALDSARAGLDAAKGIADPTLRAEVLGRLGSSALDAGGGAADLGDALDDIAAAGSADPGANAFATALRARLAFAAGDAARARGLMEQALLYESQRALPARLPEWRLRLAGMDPAHRDAQVSAAYDALEAIRPLLPRFDPLTEETAFSLYMRPVFQSAVDMQLAGADGAEAQTRVRRAQAIVETYRQAELQSVFGNECLPPRDALTPETLTAGEVILYPILLPDRLEILYLAGGAGGATFRRLAPDRSVDREKVSRLVETMVLSLSYDEDDRWRAASRQLYDLLIKPVEGDLKPGSELAIVPDGALRALPFSALLDADNRFLIQKTRVSVAPSLAYSQPGGGDARRREQLLAASLEMEVDLPAGDFEKLTGTGAEAKEAAIADGKRIRRAWVIENFKKIDLIKALTQEDIDVLHLATHASFNGRSDRAFIVANGEVILLSELRQILSANRARGDELDLLVLSACETAVGDDEASMGLAGAAVQAGSKSAIASLWPVNDQGTAELMKDFYQSYRAGASKSAALRAAQLAMIQKGGAYADPNAWAAFTLLGAWR